MEAARESTAAGATETFTAVQRAPLSVLVARQLRESIVSGALPLGTPLPTERELGEQFGVGRSTVREALRILQADGLVTGGDSVSTTRPRVSAEHTVASASRALENALRLGQTDLPALLDLRLLIERAALGEAASDPDPEALEDCRAALARMARPDVTVDTFHEADVEFHLALVGAAGNRAYRLVLGVLRDSIAAHLRSSLADLDDAPRVMQQLTAEHRQLLDDVCRGDAEAARRHVEAHVRGFYEAHAPLDPPS